MTARLCEVIPADVGITVRDETRHLAPPPQPPRERMLILHSSVGTALLLRGAIVGRLDPTAAECVQPTVLGTVEPAGVGLGLGIGVVVDGAVRDFSWLGFRLGLGLCLWL